MLGPDVLRGWPAWAPRRTETPTYCGCAVRSVRPCPSASKSTKCWKEKEVDCLPKDTGMLWNAHGSWDLHL